MNNDIMYFKTTHKPGLGILCPSCGGLITAKKQSSFRLTLTPKLSEHLNIILEMLRIHTYQTEVFLRVKASLPPIHKYGEPYAVTDLVYLERLYQFIKRGTFAEDAEKSINLPPEIKSQVEKWFESRSNPVTFIEKVIGPSGEHLSGPTAYYANLFRRTSDPDDAASRFEESMPDKEKEIDIDNPDHMEYLSFLLGTGAEPRVYGLLFDLVAHQTRPVVPMQPDLDQSEATKWIYLDDFWSMAGFFSNEKRQKNFITIRDAVIRKVLPHYGAELDRVEKALKAKEAAGTKSGAGESTNKAVSSIDNIKQSLDRVRWLLLLLHGHSYAQSEGDDDKAFQQELKSGDSREVRQFTNLFLKDAYLLPLSPNVSVQLASRLLKSRAFLSDFADDNWFNTWFKQFEGDEGNSIRFKKLWESIWNFLTLNDDTREKGFHWLSQIDLVADVSCGHSVLHELPSLSAPREEEALAKRVLRHSQKRYQPCKWRVGAAPTSSVVLLGSQATGKSCTFMSGLTRLKQCCDSLGLSVEDEDITTKVGLADYAEKLRKKEKPGATQLPQSLRFVINSSKNSGESPGSRVSFVDIPGEFVSTLDDHENARPEVAHLLHSSETIVFCFDLWADKVINEILLSDKEAGQWEEARLTFKQAQSERKDKTAAILIDQPMLLKRLANSLQGLRERLHGEVTFICLFTKADLLAEFDIVMEAKEDASGSRNGGKFLSQLFRKWLKNGWLWQDPISKHVQSFAGTTNSESKIDTSTLLSTAKSQIDFCRQISDEFKAAVGEHAERMVSARSGQGGPFGMTIKARVCESIIGFSESVFSEKNCYFLPVSSLGLGSDQRSGAEGKNGTDAKPFAPIFAEYAFLLPICLGLSKALHDPTADLPDQNKGSRPPRSDQQTAASGGAKK